MKSRNRADIIIIIVETEIQKGYVTRPLWVAIV